MLRKHLEWFALNGSYAWVFNIDIGEGIYESGSAVSLVVDDVIVPGQPLRSCRFSRSRRSCQPVNFAFLARFRCNVWTAKSGMEFFLSISGF